MTRTKGQRVHEFKIRVRFNKAVTAGVARSEVRGSLVGFKDWCLDECHADEFAVTSITPLPKTATSPTLPVGGSPSTDSEGA